MSTIATKDQERQALARIKKIVEALGENSYIGTAFAGCFEIAEWNIEADAADSFQERIETFDKARLDAQREHAKIAAENKQLKAELETIEERYTAEISRLKTENESVWRKLDEAKKAQSVAEHKAAESAENFTSASAAVDRLISEVTRLKARLYDYMTDEH